MSAKTFVDTNVLVYAHDADAGKKRIAAAAALRELWSHRSGILSPQVLQEFYVTVTRKIKTPVGREEARQVVGAYSSWCVDAVAADVDTAFRIEDEVGLNFWDALIIATAARSGAKTVLSEDLNHGQTIAGVTVRNPFRK